jgi:glycosyltransferase involved in cell wall biosynthesis
MTAPRVALFADTFHETNGVATLCREFTAFATARDLPFLCVRAGPRTQLTSQGSLTTLELKRSLASFPVDYDLRCDPLLSRYKNYVMEQVRAFKPDLVHVTGPGDFGILGFWVKHSLGVPMVASWHTNLHEYAGRRLEKMFSALPSRWRSRIAAAGEKRALSEVLRFYRRAQFLLAPNEPMVELLRSRTGKPAYFMPHGVDLERFSPALRGRGAQPFTIGYVGRLTPEKNVRLFVDLERELMAAGRRDFRLVLIGEGSERAWLARHLQQGEAPGVLRGSPLAEAFAGMDVFVFPSRTDTFGLVLLEALASGVPVVAGPDAAARLELREGVTGFTATSAGEFARRILQLMENETLLKEMRAAARRFAQARGWSGVFEHVYETYQTGLAECRPITPRL